MRCDMNGLGESSPHCKPKNLPRLSRRDPRSPGLMARRAGPSVLQLSTVPRAFALVGGAAGLSAASGWLRCVRICACHIGERTGLTGGVPG
jgi:hypothetical protein